MNLLSDARVFRKGIHQLTLINTDLAEAESLVKRLAEEEKRYNFQDFAGKESCVYFKMPYIPPCDPFKELRRLILRVHENTGLRANFKGIVAIEATEWLGHEREEYFTVLLKFLYDHRDIWRTAMVLHNCTPAQAQRFLSSCARYISPRLFDIKVFSDRETLCGVIQNAFKIHGRSITQAAAEMLAAAMAQPELKDIRSLTLIERTVEEVLSFGPEHKEVPIDVVRDYLMDPCSTLTIMVGKPLLDERSLHLEKEALQL